MEAPGREAVAEGSRTIVEDTRAAASTAPVSAKSWVASSTEHRHRHRPADDRDRERRHADQRGVAWVDHRATDDRRQAAGEQMADRMRRNNDAKNSPPRKPKPSDTIDAAHLARKMVARKRSGDVGGEIEVKGSVAGGQDLRRHDRDGDERQPTRSAG